MLDGLEIFFDLITFAYCLIMFSEQGPCTCEGQLNAWRKWTKDQGVTVHMV